MVQDGYTRQQQELPTRAAFRIIERRDLFEVPAVSAFSARRHSRERPLRAIAAEIETLCSVASLELQLLLIARSFILIFADFARQSRDKGPIIG